ncbi:hypothetical protein QBC38DRAFT_517225 [Podospora fimiseda]|uniref:Uncharacterized protein n=1 Tax=Podospora fimiseda TaxID=252190 RepID=A0AAN7BH38_9PEZI|nr:hypothetical protein QBC38DRAFT_517225 [Podospora fimiseda]
MPIWSLRQHLCQQRFPELAQAKEPQTHGRDKQSFITDFTYSQPSPWKGGSLTSVSKSPNYFHLQFTPCLLLQNSQMPYNNPALGDARTRPVLLQNTPVTRTDSLSALNWAHLRVSHRPTAAPSLPPGTDLRRRQNNDDGQICGYYPNPYLEPIACEGGTCTNVGTIRDCCQLGDFCSSVDSFPTACADYNQEGCSGYHPGTMCCSAEGEFPYCRQYHWSTSLTPDKIFTVFVCEELKHLDAGTLLATPPVIPITLSSQTKSQSTTTSSCTSSSTTASATIETAPSSTTGNAPIGAIIGGVLGGLSVIGLMVVIIVFMFFRNRRKQQQETSRDTGGESANQAQEYPPESSVSNISWRLPTPAAVSALTDSTVFGRYKPTEQDVREPLMMVHVVNSTPVEIGKSKDSPVEMSSLTDYSELHSNSVVSGWDHGGRTGTRLVGQNRYA